MRPTYWGGRLSKASAAIQERSAMRSSCGIVSRQQMGQPEAAERLKKLGVPASIANHKWPLPKLPAQMPPNVEWNPETVGEQSTNSDSNKIYARGASS